MNPHIAANLALILFLPWYAILGALFWLYPRQPRHAARRVFDAASLALALLAAAIGTSWGITHANPQPGVMWKQVLATSVSYGLFLAVLAVALVVRRRWLPRATAANAPVLSSGAPQ